MRRLEARAIFALLALLALRDAILWIAPQGGTDIWIAPQGGTDIWIAPQGGTDI